MSRESRREARKGYPDSVRLDLLEDDADTVFAAVTDLQERVSANRAQRWTNVTSIVVGFFVLVGTIASQVMK